MTGGDCVVRLLVDGFLLRAFSIRGRRSADLLGPGDVLWPDEALRVGAARYPPTWFGLTQGTVVSLSTRVTDLMRFLPASAPELLRRAARRGQLPTLQAATRKVRAADRLLALLCYLATRWGRHEGEVTLISVPLSQDNLADLIAVERPTMSQVLKLVVESGFIERRPGNWWGVRDAGFANLEAVFNDPATPHRDAATFPGDPPC